VLEPNVDRVRILHTSDWHLGRSFHREGLLDAQAVFIDHLVQTARSERVDLVAVSGDIYDRALPPVDAVRLAHEALTRLAGLGVPVLITAGNHDSGRRLGFAADLIAAAGVHLRTDPERAHVPVLCEDAHGPVAVYGLPYLEPELMREPWQLAERSHACVVAEAMTRVRRDLDSRPGARSVVLAHAWVTGAVASDSERDISVGGLSQVSASLFDGIDYVALGHLHGRQRVSDRIRYSGSPLAFSFSEASHTKGSWLVELDAAGLAGAELVPAPVPRRLSSLRGPLATLLADPALAAQEDDGLSVVLTDQVRQEDAMARLRSRFPYVLVLEFQPEGAVADDRTYGARVAGRDDLEVVAEFVRHVRGAGSTSDEGAATEQDRELLAQALEAGRLAAASA
jgi:exonuclease SbcD